VNRQSNLKLTSFKQLKTAGLDMSDLRSDMSNLEVRYIRSPKTLSSGKIDREVR
jgi:hypothetical protein